MGFEKNQVWEQVEGNRIMISHLGEMPQALYWKQNFQYLLELHLKIIFFSNKPNAYMQKVVSVHQTKFSIQGSLHLNTLVI